MLRKNVLCLLYFYITTSSLNTKGIAMDKLFKTDGWKLQQNMIINWDI